MAHLGHPRRWSARLWLCRPRRVAPGTFGRSPWGSGRRRGRPWRAGRRSRSGGCSAGTAPLPRRRHWNRRPRPRGARQWAAKGGLRGAGAAGQAGPGAPAFREPRGRGRLARREHHLGGLHRRWEERYEPEAPQVGGEITAGGRSIPGGGGESTLGGCAAKVGGASRGGSATGRGKAQQLGGSISGERSRWGE